MKKQLLSLAAVALVLASCGGNTQTEPAPAETTAKTETTPAAPAAPAAAPFTKTVSYGNINVTVSSDNASDNNKFTITTEGLTAANAANESYDIGGAVQDVLIDDITGDDSPEVFVIGRASGGGLAKVVAFSTLNKKSMAGLNFPDMSSDAKVAGVFKDGDEYQPVEGTFIMRFPMYENGTKTAKTRQLQFKVKEGEAARQLVLDRTSDY